MTGSAGAVSKFVLLVLHHLQDNRHCFAPCACKSQPSCSFLQLLASRGVRDPRSREEQEGGGSSWCSTALVVALVVQYCCAVSSKVSCATSSLQGRV